jgi:hypothetical protein
METSLLKLYNTLATIETKGDSTKTMADCLRYVEQLIVEARANQKSENTENNG